MREWGAGLMAVLPRALSYIESQGRDVDSNTQAWSVSNLAEISIRCCLLLSLWHGLYVCLLLTSMSCAKMAEPIRIPFGMWTGEV